MGDTAHLMLYVEHKPKKKKTSFPPSTRRKRGFIRVRAQGLDPLTYGLKVPNANWLESRFETVNTGLDEQSSSDANSSAQQKAQHFPIQRSHFDNQRQCKPELTSGMPKFIDARWDELSKEIRSVIVQLAALGLQGKDG